MDKYISVNKIVMKVTEDEALRTFFTLYLIEDDETKRAIIDKQFWAEVEALPENQKVIMRKKLSACFRQLPFVVAEWGKDVDAFIANYQPKKAA
jgi:NADH:ubiquinone oxidoreductase subunit